jgi:hypothetical protein
MLTSESHENLLQKYFYMKRKTQICLHEKIILEELQKMGYLTIYI